jgi:hypothetical protein
MVKGWNPPPFPALATGGLTAREGMAHFPAIQLPGGAPGKFSQ